MLDFVTESMIHCPTQGLVIILNLTDQSSVRIDFQERDFGARISTQNCVDANLKSCEDKYNCLQKKNLNSV